MLNGDNLRKVLEAAREDKKKTKELFKEIAEMQNAEGRREETEASAENENLAAEERDQKEIEELIQT